MTCVLPWGELPLGTYDFLLFGSDSQQARHKIQRGPNAYWRNEWVRKTWWNTQSLWMKVKEESEKVGLKLNIQKTKMMASGPITSWEIDGETWKQWEALILEGSKMTADGDCSHEIKRCLLLGRKVMTNLDSILKNRDITLPTEVCLVKALFSQ